MIAAIYARSKPLPTDLEILDRIYNRYYDTFIGYSQGATAARVSKVFVPIDIVAIAHSFKVDPDIVFGRLYYHLSPKHAYTKENSARVVFFEKEIGGGERDVVNFPLLSSVLAGLRYEHQKERVGTWLAVVALVLSLISIVVSVLLS